VIVGRRDHGHERLVAAAERGLEHLAGRERDIELLPELLGRPTRYGQHELAVTGACGS
jgi:hypothetical protein